MSFLHLYSHFLPWSHQPWSPCSHSLHSIFRLCSLQHHLPFSSFPFTSPFTAPLSPFSSFPSCSTFSFSVPFSLSSSLPVCTIVSLYSLSVLSSLFSLLSFSSSLLSLSPYNLQYFFWHPLNSLSVCH
ncbi:hypothetical protein ACP275_09G063700 [Erythranthe tilingii]